MTVMTVITNRKIKVSMSKTQSRPIVKSLEREMRLNRMKNQRNTTKANLSRKTNLKEPEKESEEKHEDEMEDEPDKQEEESENDCIESNG